MVPGIWLRASHEGAPDFPRRFHPCCAASVREWAEIPLQTLVTSPEGEVRERVRGLPRSEGRGPPDAASTTKAGWEWKVVAAVPQRWEDGAAGGREGAEERRVAE
ncbi:hypothetical protein AAY473_025850 [Plecturocebus cupreus]